MRSLALQFRDVEPLCFFSAGVLKNFLVSHAYCDGYAKFRKQAFPTLSLT